jgi:hypothetical protein
LIDGGRGEARGRRGVEARARRRTRTTIAGDELAELRRRLERDVSSAPSRARMRSSGALRVVRDLTLRTSLLILCNKP